MNKSMANGLQGLEKFVKRRRGGRGEWSSFDLKSLRKSLGMTQEQFADSYGLDVRAIRGWEQNQRTPERAALVLLQLIKRHPDLVRETIAAEYEEANA